MNNTNDLTGFLKNGISSYPLKILNLGNLIVQKGETEEDTVRRLIMENTNDKLWIEPQVIISGSEFNTTLTIVDAYQIYLVFDHSSGASLNLETNTSI